MNSAQRPRPFESKSEWTDPLSEFDTRNAAEVARVFDDACAANRDANCRDGSIDRIGANGLLLATGDLHDNPVHFARVVALAGLPGTDDRDPHHVTLHEVIHADQLVGGVDLSHRALLRVAALKVKDPEEVHTLLANHELSQIVGAGIVKDGVRVAETFNDGVDYVFSDDAPMVIEAIARFVRSMPLALYAEQAKGHAGGVLCAHSLPGPEMMDRFDPGVLERDLTEDDYIPRRGSAHLMVWGRRHTPEQLAELAERWSVELFVLGHEHAETGWRLLEPNAIVLNSDHEHGVVLPIHLDDPPKPNDVAKHVRPLSAVV